MDLIVYLLKSCQNDISMSTLFYGWSTLFSHHKQTAQESVSKFQMHTNSTELYKVLLLLLLLVLHSSVGHAL